MRKALLEDLIEIEEGAKDLLTKRTASHALLDIQRISQLLANPDSEHLLGSSLEDEVEAGLLALEKTFDELPLSRNRDYILQALNRVSIVFNAHFMEFFHYAAMDYPEDQEHRTKKP